MTKTIKIRCKGSRTLPFQKLRAFQGNLKEMPKDKKQRLRASILKYGWIAPVFIWQHNGTSDILDGHGRTAVLEELLEEGYKISNVPIVDIKARTRKEAAEILISINSHYQTITEEGLKDFMTEYGLTLDDIENATLSDIDMEKFAISFLDDSFEGGNTDEDQVPEVSGKTKTKPGDLFILGEHRLLCGDARKGKDLVRLMAGEKAEMVFTDPPYGVDFRDKNCPTAVDRGAIKGDDLRGDALYKTLFGAFTQMHLHTTEKPAIYVWHASNRQIIFETALNDAGFEVKQQLIWNKGMILGHSDYHWAHEPCFYAKKAGHNNPWIGDRKNKTIIREEKADFNKMKKQDLVKILTALQEESTTWEVKRDSVNLYLHPTQKPVDLCLRAMRNNLMPGGILLDLFGGSGSSIIAAQRSNRICYTMELDPLYCDVIKKRWEDYTGQKGRKEKNNVRRR